MRNDADVLHLNMTLEKSQLAPHAQLKCFDKRAHPSDRLYNHDQTMITARNSAVVLSPGRFSA